MKKICNLLSCLNELKNADFEIASNDNIYRMGVFVVFAHTFELAWKALQEVLQLYGVEEAQTASPREILQFGYKSGFINDEAVWLMMLKKRSDAIHIYDKETAEELLSLIRDSFTAEFETLEATLRKKAEKVGNQGV